MTEPKSGYSSHWASTERIVGPSGCGSGSDSAVSSGDPVSAPVSASSPVSVVSAVSSSSSITGDSASVVPVSPDVSRPFDLSGVQAKKESRIQQKRGTVTVYRAPLFMCVKSGFNREVVGSVFTCNFIPFEFVCVDSNVPSVPVIFPEPTITFDFKVVFIDVDRAVSIG